MGQRRTIELGDVTRGLNDFPESAPRGSASEALNVTFEHGGVATRRGVEYVSSIKDGVLGNDPAAQKADFIVKGFWNYTTSSGAEYFLLAWQYHNVGLGQRLGEAVLSVFDEAGQEVGFRRFKGIDGDEVFWHPTYKRWSGIHHQQANSTEVAFVIGTEDHVHVRDDEEKTEHLWVVTAVNDDFCPVDLSPLSTKIRNDGVNDVLPFWGGENVGGPSFADDIGPYRSGNTIGGNVLSSFNLRLVSSVVDKHQPNKEAQVLWSNFGDREGWPQNNIQLIDHKSPSPITGMAPWEGRLVVFTEDSLTTMRVSNGFADKNLVIEGNGCLAPETVKNIALGGSNYIFWIGHDCVYAWNGGSTATMISEPISKRIQNTEALQANNFVLGKGFSTEAAWAFNWKEKNQYWISFGETRSQSCWVYDYRRTCWSIFEVGNEPAVLGMAKSSKPGSKPFAVITKKNRDASDLRLVQMDTGGFTDVISPDKKEVVYDCRWVSNPIIFSGNFAYRFRYFRPTMTMTGDQGIGTTRDIVWMFDNESRRDQKSSGVTGYPLDIDIMRFGQNFGANVMGSPRDWTTRVDLYGGPSKTIKVGFSTTGKPFHLLSGEIDVIDRGTRR